MGTTNAQGGREKSAPMARAVVAAAPAATPPPSAAFPRPRTPYVPALGSGGHDGTTTTTPFDFATEYQKAYRVLWVVAAGVLGRSAGAEDVLQETALLALKKVAQFEPGTHFVAWMAQMVRFVALNQLRKQTRGAAAPLDETADTGRVRDLPHRAAPRRDAEACVELRLGARGELPSSQRSFDDELMRALGGLTDVARACLLLRTVEGLDYEEIGRVLAIPEGTAMSHVHRSRMRLREQLLRVRRSDTEGRRP
jgi:RNA polymerase sigma-70 factor (ECF subfamily)